MRSVRLQTEKGEEGENQVSVSDNAGQAIQS